MSDVATDAYYEILRRVPVDSLFSCRSVCKSWRTFIDNPEFAKAHISRGIGGDWIIHRTNWIGKGKLFLLPLSRHLIYGKSSNLSVESSSMITTTVAKLLPPAGPGIPHICKIPASTCDGFILITSPKKHLRWVIWNPFTGESINLPLCDEFPMTKDNSDPVTGLGYDEASDDYKAVMITGSKTFVCSVNSLVWHIIEGLKVCMIGMSATSGVYANGALHWLAYSEELRRKVVVVLDLTTQTYGNFIPLPEDTTNQGLLWLNLVVLDGCLFFYLAITEKFVVWRYCGGDDDDKLWIQMMVVNRKDKCLGWVRLIAYLKNENRLLLHYKDTVFAWYDVEQKCLTESELRNVTEPELLYSLTSQVIPSSLIRFKRGAAANENVEKLSKNKRKRADAEKLQLKVLYGAEGKST